MVRKIFKRRKQNSKIDSLIKKYNIPQEYLSINRQSVTRAMLIGLFIAFIPMPFQMLAVIAMVPFVRFNVPIALALVWISNPITMPFMYYIEYKTGLFLLMVEPTCLIEMNLEWFQSNLDEIFIPLYAGALFYSTIVSISLYYAIDWLWIHSVRKDKKTRSYKRRKL